MSSVCGMNVRGHTMCAHSFNEHLGGPAVVCIHGLLANTGFWEHGQIAAIAERVRWYSLSLPGHYPAEFPASFGPADLTAETIADVTAAALGELVGDEPVVLVGHSLGGFAALAVAARAPHLVRAVASIAGSARLKETTGIVAGMQRLIGKGALGRTLFRLELAALSSSYPAFRLALSRFATDRKALRAWTTLDAAVREMLPYARRLDARAMILYLLRLPTMDISDWLPEIKVPTLVLTGIQDRIVPHAQAQWIADHVPSVELAMIGGAGHLVMWERPDAYRTVLSQFIARAIDA